MDIIIKNVNASLNLNASYPNNGIFKQNHANAWKRLKFYAYTDMMNKTVNVLTNLLASYQNNGTYKLILVNVLIEN